MRTKQPAEHTQRSRQGAGQHLPSESAAWVRTSSMVQLPASRPGAPLPSSSSSSSSAQGSRAHSAVTRLSFDKLRRTSLTLLRHPSVYAETSKTAGDLIWHLIRPSLTAVFVIFIRGKSGTLETTAVSPFLTLSGLKALCSFHRSPARPGAGDNTWPFRKV